MSNDTAKLEAIYDPDLGVKAGRKEEQADLHAFLVEERNAPAVSLYASTFRRGGSSLLLQSVLVPASLVDFAATSTFTDWRGNPFDQPTCGLVWGGGEPPRVEYTDSLSDSDGFLASARKLVFGRSFDALNHGENYYELAQELTHAHDLHWLEERGAWCRLNSEGDVEDLVKVEVTANTTSYVKTTHILADRDMLNLHMAATGTVLLQMFDSTFIQDGFMSWEGGREKVFANEVDGLVMKFRVDKNHSSYFRGGQIIRPSYDAQALGELLYSAERMAKDYTSYITQDFKNQRILEVSCNPETLASYFDKGSELPFQTSPVFFKPEVLDKYKADNEKYSLEHRRITCRNSWSLKTFDVNEAGQVHTYISYLGNLPYSEQLYWKSFNEPPRASISRRAIKTDFEGQFSDEVDALESLKDELNKLSASDQSWFVLREPKLVEQLHYPLTAANKGWDDVLITMNKCVIEGLKKGAIENAAKSRGGSGDPKWGSIKWLGELLKALSVDADRINEICAPLGELHMLRSKLVAHVGGNEASNIRRELLKENKTPRRHVAALSLRLLNSVAALRMVLANI